MRTRHFMRTAFMLMVAMVTLARESDADIGKWIQLDDGTTMGGVYVLEAWRQRLYAGAENGIFISTDHGNSWQTTRSKTQQLRLQSMETLCMREHGTKVYFGRTMPAARGSRSGMDFPLTIWTGNVITEKFAES